jgi:hypothetical protein
MTWNADKLRAELSAANPVNALFKLFMGRCTFFAVVFTVVGIILAFVGKLTAEFVALVGAIQALLVIHSTKEDLADLRSVERDKPC